MLEGSQLAPGKAFLRALGFGFLLFTLGCHSQAQLRFPHVIVEAPLPIPAQVVATVPVVTHASALEAGTALILGAGGAAGVGVEAGVALPAPPALEVELAVPAPPAISLEAGVGVDVGVQVPVPVGGGVEVTVAPPLDDAPVPMDGSVVVEFFGIPLESAQDVVFVLDRSGSMAAAARRGPRTHEDGGKALPRGPSKLALARTELLDALRRLPATTRTNVLFFNNDLEAFAPALAPLPESQREQLNDYVARTSARGSTALAFAMRVAYMMRARRVVLLSDGLGNVGGDARAVLRDAREAMLGGIRIDTIGLGADQDRALLRKLAEESGGLYQRL